MLTLRQGPQATVDVVRKLVQNAGVSSKENVGNEAKAEQIKQDVESDEKKHQDAANPSQENTDGARAEVAAEVADTAEKLDAGE